MQPLTSFNIENILSSPNKPKNTISSAFLNNEKNNASSNQQNEKITIDLDENSSSTRSQVPMLFSVVFFNQYLFVIIISCSVIFPQSVANKTFVSQ